MFSVNFLSQVSILHSKVLEKLEKVLEKYWKSPGISLPFYSGHPVRDLKHIFLNFVKSFFRSGDIEHERLLEFKVFLQGR